MMVKIVREEDGSRGKFNLMEGEVVAGEMTYIWAGDDKFIIDHTETFDGFSGKGYGKKLVMAGIDFARERGVRIIPLCPYAKRVMTADEEFHGMIYK